MSDGPAIIRHVALLDERTKKRMSRAELAKACGVDPATIWRIESGKTSGSTPVLRKIAAYLGVPVDALFEEDVPA